MTKPIYLDYAATTPVAPEVVQAMQNYLNQDTVFANPGSAHYYGWQAQQAVADATAELASCLQCENDEIIWTSGATESNNLALKGLYFGLDKKPQIITMASEHPAVLEVCHYLESQGAKITYLKPNSDGLLGLAELQKALQAQGQKILSIMMVNNETGVVQDIQAITAMAHKQGAIVHVDAAQALGKLPIDLSTLPVDLMSFSAHKTYGPKGIGALFVRKHLQTSLQPQMHGGGQQQGLRTGTMAPHQIVGMAKAVQFSCEDMASEAARLTNLREQLWRGVADLPGVERHGAPAQLAPHILCISFAKLPAQQLLEALPDLALSAGSACHSASLEANHVLKSMGLMELRAHNALRFSLGRYTTADDIEQACQQVQQAVQQLNKVQDSLWQLP